MAKTITIATIGGTGMFSDDFHKNINEVITKFHLFVYDHRFFVLWLLTFTVAYWWVMEFRHWGK